MFTKIRFTSTYLIVVLLYLGESCKQFNVLRRGYKEKCEKWWKKALSYTKEHSSAIRRCVMLINSKCPELIKIQNTNILKTVKVYNDDTTWDIDHTATHTEKQEVVHFSTVEWHGLCEDRGAQECDLWWGTAVLKKEESYIVDRCFELVLKYCPGNTKLLHKTSEMKIHNLRKVNVVTYTYQYESSKSIISNRISFKKYEEEN